MKLKSWNILKYQELLTMVLLNYQVFLMACVARSFNTQIVRLIIYSPTFIANAPFLFALTFAYL